MGRHKEFDTDKALLSAMDVFWQHGFTNTTTQQLCAAMDINAGSLYATFESKQGLFKAAMKQYIALATCDGIMKLQQNPSGIGGVKDYFEYIVNGILTGNRSYGCFGTNSFLEVGGSDPEIQEIMTRHFELLESAFHDALLKDAVPNPMSRSRFLVCVAQGLNVLARTSPDRETLEQIVSTAIRSIEEISVAA